MFTPTEQLIHGVVRRVNQGPRAKRLSHGFLRIVGASWMRFCTGNLLRLANAEVLDRIDPDRGVLVASNHRSFSDMYLLSSVLLPRCRWIERMYFPVRSEFFYDRLRGLAVNTLVAGMAMYPPIYRQPARRALNRDAVAFLVDELRRRGTIVGMHPEGRRNTGSDPYTLLPAQPGLGEIVQRARPIVLTAFINGVPANWLTGLRANFSRRAEPPVTITITFGEPLALDEFRDAPSGPRTSLAIAQAIRADIERLGALDREWRTRAGTPLGIG